MKTKKIKNFKMNDDVYKLRRQVINLIYEVKNGGGKLPRISVRVGEQTAKHKNILGCAMMNKNQMWITKDAIDLGIDTLRNVVFHEIAHGFEHLQLLTSTLQSYERSLRGNENQEVRSHRLCESWELGL
jgi:hypothetical protein